MKFFYKSLFAAILLSVIFSSCTRQKKDIIILTDQESVASYVELFNSSQNEYRAIIEYQANPSKAFDNPVENMPDIILGPWLKNEKLRKNFLSLDYLFNDQRLNTKDFYKQLLELGNIKGHQYLLPVSFNLPLVLFSQKNASLMPDDFMLSIDQIKQLGQDYNKQNKNGVYTAMGFSPRWDSDFIYTVSKLFNTNYAENTPLFSYNLAAIDKTIEYIKDWSVSTNSTTEAEDDFKFKYLYNPSYKLITTGRCLFCYTKSDDLFSLSNDRLQNIDFRWIHYNNQIPVQDKINYIGIYRKSRNQDAAQAFILWLLKDENQKNILERQEKMNLTNKAFGIAGGFSSLKSVNEKYFPLHYPILYGHLPTAENLLPPNILPSNWEEVKKRAILPYLTEMTSTENTENVVSLETRTKELLKQIY